MQLAHAEANELPSHPVADIFPLMTLTELSALADDIHKNGQHEPIVTIDGAILDGRNRWLACRALNIVPVTVEWDRRGSPLDYVLSANLHRRQLSMGQRAIIGARLTNMPHGGDRKSDQEVYVSVDRIGIDQAAKAIGVGRALVVRGKALLRDGTPDEIAAVESGAGSISGIVLKIWQRKKERRTGVASSEPAQVIKFPAGRGCPGRPPQKIRLPDGVSPAVVARKAAAMRAVSSSVMEVATALNLRVETCRMMIDIALIADRTDLSQRDAAVAQHAMEMMNGQSMRLSDIHATIKPIMHGIWGGRRGRGLSSTREANRLERFERGLGILIQSCKNGTQMEVPHLSPERARDVVHELHRSIVSIKVLISKLEGMHQ